MRPGPDVFQRSATTRSLRPQAAEARVSGVRSRIHRRAQLAHRFARDLQLDTVTVVNDAIQDRVRQSGLAQIRMPGVDRELACDERRAGVHAVIEYFQQIGPILGRQR